MKMERMIIALLLAGLVILLEGCTCPSSDGGKAYEAPPPAPAPAMIEAQEYNPCGAPRMVETSREYTRAMQTGDAMSLVKLAPEQVILNEPFDYRLKLENLTGGELLNVVVSDVKPAHMKIISSDPPAQTTEDEIRWMLGAMGPGETKTVSVNAVATELGVIKTCAEVTFDTPTCVQIPIVQPELRLAKTAPSQSLACDRIPLKYTIENTGTGHACDISITDTLPEGMMTSEGRREVKFTLDSLGPNESRDFEVMVDASRTGQYSSSATAVARSGGAAESNVTDTMVTQPVLEIAATGLDTQYLGRPTTFTITVSNKGNAAAQDAVVETTMPTGARFGSASEGGNLSGDKIIWNIGDLQPQASKKLTFTAMMDQPGKLMTRASARAYCADAVMATAETQIVGVAGILLEVVDISDPIEIGQTETYTIRVMNQGSATDTGIRVLCQLESGMEYVSATGPTEAKLVGDNIQFAPLASLAPKAEAVWKVNVRAVGAGDKRFKVQMNSDQLGERPVQESEATRFYGPIQ